jgi:hypothetical protein
MTGQEGASDDEERGYLWATSRGREDNDNDNKLVGWTITMMPSSSSKNEEWQGRGSTTTNDDTPPAPSLTSHCSWGGLWVE